MNIKYKYLLLFTFIFFTCNFLGASNNQDQINYKRVGYPYYPEIKLTDADSLKYPINYEVSLNIYGIKDVSVNTSSFKTEFFYEIFKDYPDEYITSLNKKVDLSSESWILNPLEVTEINDLNTTTTKTEKKWSTTHSFQQGSLDHRWDLRDYPFDRQELRFTFTAEADSSIITLSDSKLFPSTFSKDNQFLSEGYNLVSLESELEYTEVKNDVQLFSPNNNRNVVHSKLTYLLILERDGVWTYFKLFFGGFLAFLISWIIFLIPKKDFEARTNLAVASIFGAISNKYFVVQSLPEIQVMTKADTINNVLIVLIIFNILIMTKQRNKKINFTGIKSNKQALTISAILFIVINLIIVIM